MISFLRGAMASVLRLFGFGLFLAAAPWASAQLTNATPPDRASAQRALAFAHVGVIPMDRERTLIDHTLVIRGGAIVGLGPSDTIQIPADADIVECDNRWFLLPGLADMHAHIRYETDLLLLLANGVTTVRNMRGTPFHLDLRRRIDEGTLLGPHIVTSGPILRGENENARTPEEAKELVDAQAAAGYDFIKVYDGLARDAYAAIVVEARAKNLPVAGHVPQSVGVEGVLAAHQASIEHAEQYVYHYFGDDLDNDRVSVIARKTAEAGTFVTPTLTIIGNYVEQVESRPKLMNRPEMKYVMPETYAWWWTSEKVGSGLNRSIDLFQKRLVRGLLEAGVPLLAGTDFYAIGLVPGFSLHRELRSLLAAGLTPYQVLETATHNPARYLRRDGHAGTVAVGFDADLVLVEGNPLEDLASVERIRGVVRGGRWMPRPELDTLLGQVAAAFGPEQKLVDRVLSIGASKAVVTAARKRQNGQPVFHESTFNLLGYALMRKKQFEDSIRIFQLVTETYPTSADAFDSLGDGLKGGGRKAAAIASYRRALAINPKSKGTQEKLEKLLGPDRHP